MRKFILPDITIIDSKEELNKFKSENKIISIMNIYDLTDTTALYFNYIGTAKKLRDIIVFTITTNSSILPKE